MTSFVTDDRLENIIMRCSDESNEYINPKSIISKKTGLCKYAYVTYIDLDIYISCAIVLAYSIRKSGSLADLVIFITSQISTDGIDILRSYFTHIIKIKNTETPYYDALKLNQYKKIVYISKNSIILKYPDHLFTLDAPAGCIIDDNLLEMKDGKIDQNDIPEIVFIISSLLNKMPTKLNLSAENLSEIIKKLVNLVCKKYKLIPDETQQESFDRLLQSSIKLLLLNQTVVKEKIKQCWSFMPCARKE